MLIIPCEAACYVNSGEIEVMKWDRCTKKDGSPNILAEGDGSAIDDVFLLVQIYFFIK